VFVLNFTTLILDQLLMGSGAIAFGVLMAYCGFWYRRRWRLIYHTPLSQIRDLREGPAKVTGQAVALAEPLHSPVLKRPCVYYKFWVLGNKSPLLRPSTLVLDSNCVSCAVVDGTGSVVLPLAEARLELAVDLNASSGPLGSGATDLVRFVEERYGARGRGISTSYKETILEEGGTIVVVGYVRRSKDGRWHFIKEKNKPLIVWDRKEEEFASKYSTWVKTCWILTALALLGGILLIILALLGVDVSPAASSG
jgi:hypothetical protein